MFQNKSNNYLFTFKDMVVHINGSYYYIISKIKTILQSSNTDNSTRVTPGNLELYFTWLNASDADVIHWYAIYAICHLIITEGIHTRLFIIDHINVNHLFDVVNKTGIMCDTEAFYKNIRPLLEDLDKDHETFVLEDNDNPNRMVLKFSLVSLCK